MQITQSTTQSERDLGMLCHLLSFTSVMVPVGSLVGPLVLWLLKRDESAFLDSTGREVLNYQFSYILWLAGASFLCFILIGLPLGLPLLFVLPILNVIFTIIGAIKARDGIVWQYPMTIPFLRA